MTDEPFHCMFGCRYIDDGLGTKYDKGTVDDVHSRHWETDCLGNPESPVNKFAVRRGNTIEAIYTGHLRDTTEIHLQVSEHDFRKFIRAGYPTKVKIVFDDPNAQELPKMGYTITKHDHNGTGVQPHTTCTTHNLEKT